MISVAHRAGLEHRRIAARAPLRRGFGHEECRSRLARQQGRQEARLLFVGGGLAEQVHIAFVGRSHIDRDRSEWRQPRRPQHDRDFAVVQVLAVRQHMRGQHARRTRLVPQFADQFLVRAMCAAARIPFIGGDDIAHERLDPSGDFLGARGQSVCPSSMVMIDPVTSALASDAR